MTSSSTPPTSILVTMDAVSTIYIPRGQVVSAPRSLDSSMQQWTWFQHESGEVYHHILEEDKWHIYEALPSMAR
jgi:hypothetical protein